MGRLSPVTTWLIFYIAVLVSATSAYNCGPTPCHPLLPPPLPPPPPPPPPPQQPCSCPCPCSPMSNLPLLPPLQPLPCPCPPPLPCPCQQPLCPPCPALPLLPPPPPPLPPPPAIPPLPCPCPPSCCCNSGPCRFRSRKRRELSARAFARDAQRLNDNSTCKNATLLNTIKQNLVNDIWLAKEMIQKAIVTKYPSTPYSIICATGDLAYTAHSEDSCFVQHNNVSCYVFRSS
ncbi:Microtubule-actin cross-linking factor [Dirofilaria immitis]